MGPAGPRSGVPPRRALARAARRALRLRRLPALLQIGMVLAPFQAPAQEPEEPIEVFWQLRHGGVVNTVVTSRYDRERFYLSLEDVFSSLQLDLFQEPAAGHASGFFVSTDRPYRIDFAGLSAEVAGRPVELEETDFLSEPTGFFLSPDALRRLFGLDFSLDERQLTLRLETPDEMPAVAAHRRRAGASRRAILQGDPTREHALLRFDRDRAWLSGGVVGYRLGLSMRDGAPRGSLSLRGGGEILGGDAELSAHADYAEGAPGNGPLRADLDAFRWRFVTGGGSFLRQARAGRLSSVGLRSLPFDGVSLTNEPVQIERFFGSTPLHVETGPEWELELYLNSQLVETARADAAGTHVFRVPITYGTTQVRVVEYGPHGEVKETERRIQIPFTFVPAGQLRYTLDAGRETDRGRAMVQATAAVGLTHWLTLKAGADYLRGAADSLPDARNGYLALSARVGGPFILTGTAAPGGLFTAGLSAYHASLLSYTLEFRRYGDDGFYHPGRSGHETQASLTAPLRFRDVPVYLRANLTERRNASGRYDFNLSPEVSFQPGGFQLSLGYRGSGSLTDGRYAPSSQLVETRLGYSFRQGSGTHPLLRGTLVSARSTYDLHRNTLQSLNLNLARTISSRVRAQFDLSHLLASGTTTLGLRVQLTTPHARASSGLQAGSGLPVTWSQDVSGAVSYDAGTGDLALLQQDWVGRSAATLRLFVDADGDGRWDRGETLIENGGVRFRQAVSTQRGPGHTIIATNLLAYERYSLEVDQSRIRNPLWVPRFEEFSFIADPNRHKTVEIPFFVSGTVTGSVLQERDGGLKPVPGLKLHLRQADGPEVRQQVVFSDGSFDLMGLPPGEYELRVDSEQLDVLRAVSEPAVRRFTLEASEDGDVVDGLDFRLRPRD